MGCPDILLLQCEELAVIDNLSGKLYLIVYADPPSLRPTPGPALQRLEGAAWLYSVSAPVVKATESHPPSATLPRPITWPLWSGPRS